MTISETSISPLWSKLAKSVLGNKYGIHCHWCKSMSSDEGEITCKNPKSKFNDGDRIRIGDGEGCAKECGLFELDEDYKSDEMYNKTFRRITS